MNDLTRENVVLLFLGENLGKRYVEIPIFNFEQEMFLIWYIIPEIKKIFKFEPSKFCAHSNDLIETIKQENQLWEFSNTSLKITKEGKKEYKKLYRDLIERENYRQLLTSIVIIRGLYDNLHPDELFLLMIDSYPYFLIKSGISEKIIENHEKLLESMLNRNMISDDRAEYIRKNINKYSLKNLNKSD